MGDAKEQRDFLDNVLSNDFTTFTVSGFEVQNAASLTKDLTTSYSLNADHFAKSIGPLLMVRPRVLGSEGAGNRPQDAPRSYQFEADHAGNG